MSSFSQYDEASELEGLGTLKPIDLDDLGRISIDINTPKSVLDNVTDSKPAVLSIQRSNDPARTSFMSNRGRTDSPTSATIPASASAASAPMAPGDSHAIGGVGNNGGQGGGGYRELRLDDDEETIEPPQNVSFGTSITSFFAGKAGSGSATSPTHHAASVFAPVPDKSAAAPLPSVVMMVDGADRTLSMPADDEAGDKLVTQDDDDGWNKFRRAVVGMQFLNAGNICGMGGEKGGGCFLQ
ncbi:hypothetical protein HK101_002088 [Irineochytrium annulatum]|nr:hypothetical protein HK101_002088 [Irineochytrium annulatum]